MQGLALSLLIVVIGLSLVNAVLQSELYTSITFTINMYFYIFYFIAVI